MAMRTILSGAAVLALLIGPALAQSPGGSPRPSGADLATPEGKAPPADRNGINPLQGEAENSGSGSGGNAQATGTVSPTAQVRPTISPQQRTEIKATLSRSNIRAASNIEIADVSLGAEMPAGLDQHWVAVPAEILRIVPAWKDYRVVKIKDETVFVDPASHKIVYIIDG